MCDCAPEEPQLVIDYAGGAEVCCQCGVVVTGQVFDEGRDWLCGEDVTRDQSRAGPAQPAFLGSSGGTFLVDIKGVSQRVLGAATSDYPARLAESFRQLEQYALAMCISTDSRVVVAAKELFRDAQATGSMRGDRGSFAAAALYFGAKMEQVGEE